MSEELIARIYNHFDPFQPLNPGDPAYVDCSAVRGNENIFVELGSKILFSNQPTYQLYAGHRGAGKSTELLRLQKHLEEKKCKVVYFNATDGDLDEQDTEYTDILLACTRHILEELNPYADAKPLTNWLRDRWQSLKDLALTEIEFEKLDLQGQISQFAKITATLRAIPSSRQKIREQVDPHTTTLTKALNDFIAEAQQKLGKNHDSKLVVIVDSLDRIVPIRREHGRTNYEEIYLDRSGQLKALKCHIIYTIPISLVYSHSATEIRDSYDTPQVLPMIMWHNKKEEDYEPGIDKLKEIIHTRIKLDSEAARLSLDTEIFDSQATRVSLCKMSGGHLRELMLLMQKAMQWSGKFPLTKKAVEKAISQARDSYRTAVYEKDWSKLAEVYQTKSIANEDDYRALLFRRCVLEYQEENQTGENNRWYDINPLLKDTEELQRAIDLLRN